MKQQEETPWYLTPEGQKEARANIENNIALSKKQKAFALDRLNRLPDEFKQEPKA